MSNMTYTQVAFSGVSGSDGQGQSGQMTVPMGGLLAARFRAHDRLTGSTDRQQFRGCRKSTYRCRKNALTDRSEEHTSELQSRLHLVCRLLLEKKKNLYRGTSENTAEPN